MIYEHFRATGACEAAQGLSDLFNMFAFRTMTFKISTQDGTKLYLQQVKYNRNGPGRFFRVKIAGFCSASDCIGHV